MPTLANMPLVSNEDPAQAQPIRVPKLTYRNHSNPSSPASKLPMSGTHFVPGQRGAASREQDDAITPIPTNAATRQIDWAVQPPSKNKPSPANTSTTPTEKKAKKKGISLFDFLAVKEPTTGALEQYAQSQKKHAAAKGTSFMAGITSQKLPAEVPKVNTKWDGLPQAAKADQKRVSTASATALYERRDSVATSSSSSKLSRKSHISAVSSSGDFDLGPSLSREHAGTNPRHDSGTDCQSYGPDRRTASSSVQMSGALPPSEKKRTKSTGDGVPDYKDQPAGRSKPDDGRRSLKLSPKARHDIAPWAEPPRSTRSRPSHAASGGVDDMEFITASAAVLGSGKQGDENADGKVAEAERGLAALSMAASRMPPSSNAQALARLESMEDMRKAQSADLESTKQKKGKSRFMRFPGKS